jgi:hypothetical protein
VDLLPEAENGSRVGVLWSHDRPPVRTGDRVRVAELARYGSLLTDVDTRGHALFNAGLYYFTSVAIHHELAYVGEARRYAAVDEVTNLTATNRGDAIRLQWDWPETYAAVLVAHDHTGWPPDPTVAGRHSIVAREEYERSGHYDVPATGRTDERDFFLVVAAVVRRADETFVSSGVRCQARVRPRIRLEYEMSSSKRQNHVRVRVSGPVRLPELVVVGRSDEPPSDERDGDVLYRQQALRIRQNHTITFPTKGKPMYGRLFLRGDTGDVQVTVVPPQSPNRLRLR